MSIQIGNNRINLNHAVLSNHRQAAKLIETAEEDDIIGVCLITYIRQLFVKPLVCTYKNATSNETRPPIDVLNRLMNRDYYPVFIDVTESLLLLGKVCYTFYMKLDPVMNVEVPVPVEVPYWLYEESVVTNSDFSQTLIIKTRLTPDHQLQHNPKCFMFYYPSMKPNRKTGKLRSFITPSARHTEYTTQMYTETMLAVKQRAHPPVAYQRAPQTMTQASTHARQGQSNPDLFLNNKDSKTVDIDISHQMARLTKRNNRVNRPADSSLNNAYLTNAHGTGTKRQRFYTTMEDNMHQVPDDYIMGPQPQMPEPYDKLLEIDSDRKEHILAQFGIPASIILSGARNSSKTATNMIDDNDMVIFQKNMLFNKGVYQRFAEEVYAHAYQLVESDILIEFPGLPNVTQTQIERDVDRNIIPTDVGKEYSVALSGYRPSDVLVGENEHLCAPIGLNEQASGPYKKAKIEEVYAKVENEKADAAKKRAEAKAIVEGEGGEGAQEIKRMEKEIIETEHKCKMEELTLQLEVIKAKSAAAIEVSKQKVKENHSAPATSSS